MKLFLEMKHPKTLTHYFLLICLLVISVTCSTAISSIDKKSGKAKPEHYNVDRFQNPSIGPYKFNFLNLLKISWRYTKLITNLELNPRLERIENDVAYLNQNKTEFSVTWVGHSTLLIQMEGYNFLTDPIWSKRCSPMQMLGPKRFVIPGLDFDKLPDIDFVIISHDHYDHLDKSTVIKLSKLGATFFVPLKVKSHFQKWGVKNVMELDWWDSAVFGDLTIHCTPAQHFSGRTLWDLNKTLWSSWVVIGKEKSFYFGGDTGYFKGFKDIAQRLGPFDLVALPIGGYSDLWKEVHITPEEALIAYEDLHGKDFVPIHWATFRLGMHSWYEPVVRLKKEINRRKLEIMKFHFLQHGETKILKDDSVHIVQTESPSVGNKILTVD